MTTNWHLERIRVNHADPSGTKSAVLPPLHFTADGVTNIVDVDWTSERGAIWVTLLIPVRQQ